MRLSVDEIIERKKPVEITWTIYLDPSLRGRLAAARQVADDATRLAERNPELGRLRDKATRLRGDLETLETEAKEDSVVFRFHGLSHDKWEKLIKANPPSDEQKKAIRKDPTIPVSEKWVAWNVDTFSPEIIAATCVEPEMTLEQAQRLLKADTFNDRELAGLVSAAIASCTTTGDITGDDLATLGKD